MKFRFSERVLRETTVELSVDLPTALDRLRQLQGICRDTDSDQQYLECICKKNGELWIIDASRREKVFRVYTVRGEIYVEDGVTKATVYEIYDRLSKGLNLFTVVFWVVLFLVSLLLSFSTKYLMLELLALVFWVAVMIRGILRQETYKEEDLDIQKAELLRRLEAVERWDD